MMKLNRGFKSALFAITMMVAIPATTHTQQVASLYTGKSGAFVAAAALFIIDTRLRTKSRADFSRDDLKGDFNDLLNSLNIFDSKLYKQLGFMFDKYIIGLPIKIEDCTKRKAEDKDGMVLTIKSKKLSQKPFGAYGLFDAYVLSHMKKFATETCAAAGLLYVYLNFPALFLEGAVNGAYKTVNVTVKV